MSTRNILLIASVMIYVDLTLRAVDDSQMARLRSMQVILLSPLLALVFALFLYQGHLSDYMHYTDDSQATINWFNMIVLVNTALWYICFLMLGVFVLVGRRKFAKYLIGLEAQAYVAGSTSGGNSTSGTHGTSGLGRFGWRQQQTDSKESGSNNPQKKLIKVIKGAIATMWWIALWIGVFLVYSVIFAFSVLYFGDADVIYFLTLAINWCGPSFYAVAIFIFFFVRTASQYRELREEVSDAEGSGAGASSFSIGWRPSLDDGPISGATSPSLLPGVVNASRMESPPARPGSANMHPMQTFEPAARPPLNSSAGASEWRGSGR
ncbi:hypothetical protein HK101_005817 [Irineochytrium annulatum]|nr:hypothetical protein HK101_005817 [Irineochytrium annulatum]